MKRRAHFIRLYRRLDLPGSATLDDLKHNYHFFAARYHPDKSEQDEALSDNTELFKEIQAAYRELRRFHNEHGFLPLSVTQPTIYPASGTETAEPEHKIKHPSLSSSIILGSIGILFITTLLYTPDSDMATHPNSTELNGSSNNFDDLSPAQEPLEENKSPAPRNPQQHPLKLGMTMGETFELLGVPDAAVGDQWFYGNSEVYFRDGRVAGWNNSPDSPITTDCTLPANVAPIPPRPGY